MTKRVLEKPHKIGGCPIFVVEKKDGSQPQIQTKDESPAALEISGFKSSTHEDVILMYFENTEKSGGGEIAQFEMSKSKNSMVITFTDPSGKL